MRNAVKPFRPIQTPMHTPALTAVVLPIEEEVEQTSATPTWRARLRTSKSFAAIVAFGFVLGGLGFLDSRGELKPNAVAHAARIGGLNTIRYVLSVEEKLGLKAAPHHEIEVREVDADWTPPPLDAKPWEPTPYVPIQPASVTAPSAIAIASASDAAPTASAAATKRHAKIKKSARSSR